MINQDTLLFEQLALFEMTPDLVCIAGKDGYFRKVNPAVLNKLQYSAEELYPRLISSFIHPDDRELTARERMKLLEGKTLLNFQNRYLRKDGTIIWLEWTSVYLPDKEIVFAIAKDISENKRKEKEIEDRYNTYKNLVAHFKARAEEDKKWLAYELHEEVAQMATALKLSLEGIDQYKSGLKENADFKINEAFVLCDLLVDAIRRISFSLSPAMLDDIGFTDTLEWICKEFAIMNGIACQFVTDCDEDELPGEIKIDIFRICQEALNEIRVQATATKVKITLQNNGDSISLNVADDGKDASQSEKPPGLINMRQLATSMNASFTLTNEKGKGKIITLVINKTWIGKNINGQRHIA